MVTNIYYSVNNTGPCVYTCLFRHIAHMSGAIFHPPHDMYTCTHVSTPGTTARQRLREKLMQSPETPHVSSVQHDQIHLAPPTPGLHCTHFLRPQYPSLSQTPSPLPNKPKNNSRTAGKRGFTVPILMSVQSAKLWRSSMQLHSGLLRSCRKIGGKSAVQQSPSRRARKRPIPKTHDVGVCERRRINAE